MVAVKKKQIKIEYLVLVVLALLMAGAAGLLVRPVRDPDISHRAALGDVVWNHELHARMKGLTCQVCHHTTRAGVTNPEPCLNCHREPPRGQQGRVMTDVYKDLVAAENPSPPPPPKPRFRGPGAMDAYHGKCRGCHQAMNQGPISCRDCHAHTFSGPHGRVEWDHRKHSRQMKVECAFCHHTSEGRPESEVPGCRQCHEGAAATRADMTTTGIPSHQGLTHAKCGECHVEGSPSAHAPSCVVCHKQMKAAGGAAPIEQAIHQKCFACHNEKVKGGTPRTTEPNYCSDCHRRDPSFINTSAGPVLWTHEAHGQEYQCRECHHDRTGQPNEPFLSCDQCHHDRPGGVQVKAEMPVSPAADAVHNQCLGCHREKKAGPVECNSCHSQNPDISVFRKETEAGTVIWDHRFHAVGLAFSCQECHHNMRSRDGILYTVCKTADCPTEAGGPKACTSCHPGPGAAAPAPAPVDGLTAVPAPAAPALIVPASAGASDAAHGTCIGCHQKLAGPVECDQCHVQSPAGNE